MAYEIENPIQEGNFLSPFDFLRQLLTFFLFNAAFKRFVLARFFIFCSPLTFSFSTLPFISIFIFSYLTSQIPVTINAVPTTLVRVTPSFRMMTLRKAVTKG